MCQDIYQSIHMPGLPLASRLPGSGTWLLLTMAETLPSHPGQLLLVTPGHQALLITIVLSGTAALLHSITQESMIDLLLTIILAIIRTTNRSRSSSSSSTTTTTTTFRWSISWTYCATLELYNNLENVTKLTRKKCSNTTVEASLKITKSGCNCLISNTECRLQFSVNCPRVEITQLSCLIRNFLQILNFCCSLMPPLTFYLAILYKYQLGPLVYEIIISD